MTTTQTSRRPRLTAHQREVFDRLQRKARFRLDGFVAADVIGSHGALEHLFEKGYAERQTSNGPRGGVHYFYKPVI